MVGNILYIALLCVYSVVLIVITLNYTKYMTKIKQWLKNRKKQKQQKLENTIKDIVLSYLKELQNEGTQGIQQEEWNTSETEQENKYIGETAAHHSKHRRSES